jgi:C-terminal processing protease CtpA/Prc
MSLSQKERTKILSSIKARVLKHHINVTGISYDSWTRLFDQRAPQLLSGDTDAFETGVQELLSELGTSHTRFYHECPNRVVPQHSINATLHSFPQAGGGANWIFLDVFEDGPADMAGIKPGEMLVAVDDTAYVPPSMPPFKLGGTHTLRVSNVRGENPRDIVINVPSKRAARRLPIVESKGLAHATVGPNVGLVKTTYFRGEMGMRFSRELDATIKALKDRGCKRLIIDLRGNVGGGLGFARLASYMCPGQIPIGNSLTPGRLRKGYQRESLPRVPMPRNRAELLLALARFTFQDKSLILLTQGLGPQPFHDNIALLINECTYSAAEIVASFASENRLATIVGKKTAGNVLGQTYFKVGSGYWLCLPVFGWYTSQGNSLEGKGVSPDVVVDVDPLLLSTGIDQQMEKAIEILNDTNGGGSLQFSKGSKAEINSMSKVQNPPV